MKEKVFIDSFNINMLITICNVINNYAPGIYSITLTESGDALYPLGRKDFLTRHEILKMLHVNI